MFSTPIFHPNVHTASGTIWTPDFFHLWSPAFTMKSVLGKISQMLSDDPGDATFYGNPGIWGWVQEYIIVSLDL